MVPYGFKLPGLASEVLDEVERKYSNATRVTDDIVKVAGVDPELCNISLPRMQSDRRPSSQVPSNMSSPRHYSETSNKVIAKIAATNPNMSPAFRIIADSKICLKGNRNQSPESIHRRGW